MPFLKDNFARIRNALEQTFEEGIEIVDLSDPGKIHSSRAKLIALEGHDDSVGFAISLNIQLDAKTTSKFFYWEKKFPDLDAILLDINIRIQLFQLNRIWDNLEDGKQVALSPSQLNFVTPSTGREIVFKDVKQVWDIPGRTFNYPRLFAIIREADNKVIAEDRFFHSKEHREPQLPAGLPALIHLGGIRNETFYKHFNHEPVTRPTM